MTTPTVLTIILNWRSAQMTLGAAMAAAYAMEDLKGEILIVDNDSGDGSEEQLKQWIAEADWKDICPVRVIQSGHNGGFGFGNNVGIKAGLSDGSRPDYVYILNSDAFPEKGAICALVRHLENHPEVGFAGSEIHGSEMDRQLTAFRFPTIFSEFEGAARTGPISRLLSAYTVPIFGLEKTGPVEWIAGCSLLMRDKVLQQVGLFDETYFLYFEETDLCARVQGAGWGVDHVAESKVMHIGSQSTGMGRWKRIPGYWLDSRWYYFVKHHGRAYAIGATVAHVLGGLIWRLRRMVTGKAPIDPPRFLSDLLRHALGHIAAPLPPSKVPAIPNDSVRS